jgi:hypothetical protein
MSVALLSFGWPGQLVVRVREEHRKRLTGMGREANPFESDLSSVILSLSKDQTPVCRGKDEKIPPRARRKKEDRHVFGYGLLKMPVPFFLYFRDAVIV